MIEVAKIDVWSHWTTLEIIYLNERSTNQEVRFIVDVNSDYTQEPGRECGRLIMCLDNIIIHSRRINADKICSVATSRVEFTK